MNEDLESREKTVLEEYRWFLLFLGIIITGYVLLVAYTGMLMPMSVVKSDSMLPVIAEGDLILVKSASVENLEVGNIIVYETPPPYPSPTIHRIIDKWTEDDVLYFKTKGDNNPVPDNYRVPASDIIAEYTGIRLPYLGYVVLFIQTPLGIILFIGLFSLWIIYDYVVKDESPSQG